MVHVLQTKHEPFPVCKSTFSALNKKQISNQAKAVIHAPKWAHKQNMLTSISSPWKLSLHHTEEQKEQPVCCITCCGLHVVSLSAHQFSSQHWCSCADLYPDHKQTPPFWGTPGLIFNLDVKTWPQSQNNQTDLSFCNITWINVLFFHMFAHGCKDVKGGLSHFHEFCKMLRKMLFL